jgi:L-threonylcarbamoyladenylate synthase
MPLRLNLSSSHDLCTKSTAEVLLAGGLVVYPTDTLYGIGCDATSEEAVSRIRKAKGRDAAKPLSIIVFDLAAVEALCVTSAKQRQILSELLPGPYTFILKLKTSMPCSPDGTIGIRVPEHIFMRQVSREIKRPIVSTSANLSGEKEPAEAGDIAREIAEAADLIIDGGKCKYAQGSTVIDLIHSKVLRKGAIRQGDSFEWEK